MGWVVAFAGQKGGVGKTTAATGFAVSAAQHGARVQLGDMDSGQQSAMSWGERRKANKHEPPIDVRVIVNEKAIALARELVDVLVLDLPGRADYLTLAVAQASDLIVVVSDTNALELEPTVNFLRALEKEGLREPRVVVTLSKVRDDKREADARAYLAKEGFEAVESPMRDYGSVHDIGNDGRSPLEVSNSKVVQEMRKFFDGLMSALARATEPLRTPTKTNKRDKGRGR